MRIARRKQTRGGGIPFPKPFKLVLRAGFFMASTIEFIARFPLQQDVAINSWKYSWQNLLYHCLYLSFLCFWLICLNFEIIENIYFCEINGYCIASIVYEFRGDVFFLLLKKIGKNIKVIVKIAITRVLSSRGPLCQILSFFFYISPAMRPRSLTRDDDTRLRAYTSLPLQVEPAVGNGHGKWHRWTWPVTSVTFDPMRRVCRRSWCSSTTHGPH